MVGAERPGLWAHLHQVASRTRPFQLRLGRASTFLPDSPTLHLSVEDPSDSLPELVDSLDAGPFARERRWPFVPHVTLRTPVAAATAAAGVEALTGSLGEWTVDSMHVLEYLSADGEGRWTAVDEVPFGPPRVLGRGGLEWSLVVRDVVDAEASELSGVSAPRGVPLVVSAHQLHGAEPSGQHTPGPMVGAVVGATDGAAARLEAVGVAAEWRGYGADEQLLASWLHEASRRGAIVATADVDGVDPRLLAALGFVDLGGVLVRPLGGAGR